MMGRKICFNRKIWIIIPKLSVNTLYLEHCSSIRAFPISLKIYTSGPQCLINTESKLIQCHDIESKLNQCCMLQGTCQAIFWKAGPRGYKTFFILNSAEHENLNTCEYKNIKKNQAFSCSDKPRMLFFLLINVKMPTIVGILTYMSRKKIMLS